MGAPRGKLGRRHFVQRAVRAGLVMVFAEGFYFFFGVFEICKPLLVWALIAELTFEAHDVAVLEGLPCPAWRRTARISSSPLSLFMLLLGPYPPKDHLSTPDCFRGAGHVMFPFGVGPRWRPHGIRTPVSNLVGG